MSLISLVVMLIFVGVLLWAVNQIDQIATPIKKLINILVVVAVVLFILNALLGGYGGGLHDIRIGR